MIDGRHASFRCVERARFAGGVYGYRDALAARFIDGGGELGLCELEWSVEASVGSALVAARFVDLDVVGACLDLAANGCDEFVCRVGVVGVRGDVLVGIEMDGVFVAAEDGDGIA